MDNELETEKSGKRWEGSEKGGAERNVQVVDIAGARLLDPGSPCEEWVSFEVTLS